MQRKNQEKDQAAVLEQIHRYLVIQNVTDAFVPLLLREGYCYGFSVCRAAMRALGKLHWWKACIDHVLAWNGEICSLKNKLVLPGASKKKPISLQTIFERVIHYIVFNQTGEPYTELSQDTFLLPGGPFILQRSNDKILRIKSNHRMAGRFTVSDIVTAFKDKATIRAIKNNICLAHSAKHTCEFGYVNKSWYFYNPNYLDGKEKTFIFVESVVREIVDVLGHNICIEIACLHHIKVKPFAYYHQLIDQCPVRLMRNDGLYKVARYNTELVPRLLKDCKNIPHVARLINQMDADGWTPLMFAARYGHAEAIQALCAAGVDVDRATIVKAVGWTPLMLAASSGHAKAAQALCAAGAEVDQMTDDGWSPLMLAALYGRAETVQTLCIAGAKVDQSDAEGWTSLMLAAQYDHVDTLSILLNNGAHPNQVHSSGCTAMILAVQEGHIDIVHQLLPRADLTMITSAHVPVLLEFATQKNRLQQVEAYLKKKYGDALPEYVPGFTALHMAVFFGHTRIASILLNKITDLSTDTFKALHQLASAINHAEILSLLTARRVAVNNKTAISRAGFTLFNIKNNPAGLRPDAANEYTIPVAFHF